jgi:hypothetical protein
LNPHPQECARLHRLEDLRRQVNGAVAADDRVVLAASTLRADPAVADRDGAPHPHAHVGVVGDHHDRRARAAYRVEGGDHLVASVRV